MIATDLCRLLMLTVIVPALIVSITCRRRANRAGGRVDRRADGLWFLIPTTIFGVAVVAAFLTFLITPHALDFSAMNLPPAARYIGAPLGWIAVALIAWTFHHLGPNLTATASTRPHHTLITTGPYRHVRHPFYLSALPLMASHVLLTDSWFILGASTIVLALLAARTRREEANLLARFGSAYSTYRNRTGCLLPRLRG